MCVFVDARVLAKTHSRGVRARLFRAAITLINKAQSVQIATPIAFAQGLTLQTDARAVVSGPGPLNCSSLRLTSGASLAAPPSRTTLNTQRLAFEFLPFVPSASKTIAFNGYFPALLDPLPFALALHAHVLYVRFSCRFRVNMTAASQLVDLKCDPTTNPSVQLALGDSELFLAAPAALTYSGRCLVALVRGTAARAALWLTRVPLAVPTAATLQIALASVRLGGAVSVAVSASFRIILGRSPALSLANAVHACRRSHEFARLLVRPKVCFFPQANAQLAFGLDSALVQAGQVLLLECTRQTVQLFLQT
jgi:hypothetical protein